MPQITMISIKLWRFINYIIYLQWVRSWFHFLGSLLTGVLVINPAIGYHTVTFCQARSYLPSQRTSLQFGEQQIILLCWCRHVCEQLARSCYLAAKWSGDEPVTSWLWDWCPNHYTTKLHSMWYTLCNDFGKLLAFFVCNNVFSDANVSVGHFIFH